jgi:hypothetical protein
MPSVAEPVASSTDSVGGPSSGTGPLPGSPSTRRKKGIVFPAIGVAALIVAVVAVASYLVSPNGKGASGLAPVLESLPHSNSVAALETERQELIAMDNAAGTLAEVTKPVKVSPSEVMASAAASASASAAAAAASASASAAAAASAASNSSSSGSGSTQVVQAAPPDPGTAQQIGYDMLPDFGYSQTSEWTCLLDLWNQESGWRYDAENPSGAYGIPQALPGDKMATAGSDWQTDPTTQIRWGLGYIQSVYGTPCGAWDHEVADGWY